MIMICGLPNAGKTTYSSVFSNCIHYDELRMTTRGIYRYLYEKAAQGELVVEGVFGEKRRRREMCELVPDGERKVCIWLDTPLDECIRREKTYRKRSIGMVEAHARRFQPPTYDEGWDEIIIVR